jgi:hypothetical protein
LVQEPLDIIEELRVHYTEYFAKIERRAKKLPEDEGADKVSKI